MVERVALVASQADSLQAFESLLRAALQLWYVGVLVAVVGAAKLAYRIYLDRRISRSGIGEIDRMNGQQFEQYLATMFRRLGYRVERTQYRGDYGADLVVSKDGVRTAVQAKRWSKSVGVKAVQEAVASKGYYRCDAALVVANRSFTRQAVTLAGANGVELWDRDELVARLLDAGGEHDAVSADREREQPEPAPAEEATCVTCGTSVSAKVRDYCLAAPARFGGKIYCYRHQRPFRSSA